MPAAAAADAADNDSEEYKYYIVEWEQQHCNDDSDIPYFHLHL